jgi:hypothetical protein
MALGAGFSPSSLGLPVNIIPPWLSIFIYHLRDEKYARWWPQFTDIVSLVDMNSNPGVQYHADNTREKD